MKLSPKQIKEYGDALFDIDSVFRFMWERGGIVFNNEYDTAALEIVGGKFRISFNPRYWKKLSKENRLFIICHEYLHMSLGHWLNQPGNIDAEWMNIAQDIQINEMLVKYYGFFRKDLKGWKEQAWIDVVFKDKAHLVKEDQDPEYYYKLLMQCLEK